MSLFWKIIIGLCVVLIFIWGFLVLFAPEPNYTPVILYSTISSASFYPVTILDSPSLWSHSSLPSAHSSLVSSSASSSQRSLRIPEWMQPSYLKSSVSPQSSRSSIVSIANVSGTIRAVCNLSLSGASRIENARKADFCRAHGL